MRSTLNTETFPAGIYVLDEGGVAHDFRGNISLSVDEAFEVTRAEKSFARVQVRWAMGRRVPRDVVYATTVAAMVISERVVNLLRDGQFSGWTTYPVDLIGKDGDLIEGFHGLAIHGRCGPIEDSRSVKVDKIFRGGIFPSWFGLYFDPTSWDGSDLFMPAGRNAWIFAVEGIKRAFEKAKIRNVAFRPLADVERTLY